jgi:hypothetical protein
MQPLRLAASPFMLKDPPALRPTVATLLGVAVLYPPRDQTQQRAAICFTRYFFGLTCRSLPLAGIRLQT